MNAHLMAAPRVARLGTHATGEDFALDLPRDKAAAAQYLRGIERARVIELESIRALRRRIEGDRWRNFRLLGRRGLTALLAVMVVGSVAWWWQDRSPSEQSNAGNAGVVTTDHTAHQSMGSGVAVEFSDSQISASRKVGEPGLTTFILRNTSAETGEFVIVPRSRIRGMAASLSADELHAAAVAAKHELEPGSREELAVELAAGEYVLISSHAGVAMRSAPFSVG